VICAAAGCARFDVTPLITTKVADGASDNVVPETVIANPPGARFWSPIINVVPEDSGSGLKTLLPTLIVGGAGLAILEVTPSITMKDAEGPIDTVVPKTVIAEPPGAKV
jgi:hypothetical protein